MILLAVRLLGCWRAQSRVVFRCDNAATVAWLSGGAPRPPVARVLTQKLFALCLPQAGMSRQHHIRLAVVHSPDEQNVLVDALSRRR